MDRRGRGRGIAATVGVRFAPAKHGALGWEARRCQRGRRVASGSVADPGYVVHMRRFHRGARQARSAKWNRGETLFRNNIHCSME
jgi:hypothetical protein